MTVTKAEQAKAEAETKAKEEAAAKAEAEAKTQAKPSTKGGFVYQGNGEWNGFKKGDAIPEKFFDGKPCRLAHMLKTQKIKKA